MSRAAGPTGPAAGPSRAGGPAAREGLGRARVLVVGLEPWGIAAAVDLAAAGVGALHVLDSGVVTDGDLLAARALAGADRGRARADALRDALAREAPGCAVSSGPLLAEAEEPLRLEGGRWDLILACVPGDDLLVLEAVARLAHAAGAPSISAYLDDLEAVIGPAVVPGETACFRCARLRRLANSEHPEAEHALQRALLAERPRPRAPACLSPAAGLLGHALAVAALEMLAAPRASRLAGRVLVRDLVTLRASLHAVLPMPRCEVCGGARAALRGDGMTEGYGARLDTARDPAELRRMLAGVVDARTGIVRRLALDSPSPTAYPEAPRTATAALCTFTDGRHPPHRCGGRSEMGSGKGLTAVDALLSAAGEAVERYSASRFEPAERLRAAVAAMRAAASADPDRDFLPPERLSLYAEGQYAQPGFRHARLGEDTPIDWVPGRWLDTGARVWLPALPVYFDLHVPPEEDFCQVTSNGLAAGPTRDAAARSAALELIERDAFMISWLARLPGRRIEIDGSVDAGTREVARQLAAHGARVELYLLDVGLGVPTVVSVGFGDGRRWPGATVGMAAHLSPHAAIRKAMLEQGHVGPYLRRRMVEGELPVPGRPEDVRTLIDHAAYYAPPDRAAAFAFLGAGEPVRAADLAEPEDLSLAALVARVRAAGLRVAIADVTSPDLAATPFRVARALGPDFQQIHFGHGLARLGNPRLLALSPGGFNPDPHPMA